MAAMVNNKFSIQSIFNYPVIQNCQAKFMLIIYKTKLNNKHQTTKIY